MTSLDRSLENLRKILINLQPTGSDGFEGLVATALADITGLVFRLAKSGSQFGRDASTENNPFAIAMEAKRYKDDLSLEDLAGKAALAGYYLENKVDLWILVATSKVGDDTVRQLSEILETYGVSLLVLDWTSYPLPPLAVLLVSGHDQTLGWFENVGKPIAPNILHEISNAPSFQSQKGNLRERLNSAEIGLDALRQHTRKWVDIRFKNRDCSQKAFGQYITISDPSELTIPRSRITQLFANAMVIDSQKHTLVAVLGVEGIGKTWLVAQWWAALSEPPILIFVAGRRCEKLDPSEPLKSLANLLAQQDEHSDETAIAKWSRRLKRWRGQGLEERLRFVLVLDGLNENAEKPWADILKSLIPEVHALGGLVVATSREAFWNREIVPRLGNNSDKQNSLTVRKVSVTGYTDEELESILARVGVTPMDLPNPVREFVRNPRTCSVALNLINRLSLQPNELTVERLLLEHWKQRLEERGDLIGHNIQDFENLLRSHARTWLDHPNKPFNRDNWMDHSGAIRRTGGRNHYNDLTEIEEGRFLKIISADSGTYQFQKETLPFALGLLVTHELKTVYNNPNAHANEQLNRILDPVRGFDMVAEIIAAAVGLACLDDDFPQTGRLDLIRAWLELQNVSNETFETIAAYISARPDAFLDTAELPEVNTRSLGLRQSLLGLLVYKRDHPRVSAAIHNRLPQWLGRWSRKAQVIGKGDEQIQRQNTRETRIAEALGKFSRSEHEFFNEVCTEVLELTEMKLDRAATLLMAGRTQAHYAYGLVAWAYAQTVAGDILDAARELAWVVRLNPVDHTKTEETVRQLISWITPNSSEPMRRGAAKALNLLGTQSAAALAESLFPRKLLKGWRRVEIFCDTNPHDPNAPAGSNLKNARTAAGQIQPLNVWNHMGTTSEDNNLEHITPALSRFEPDLIVTAIQEVAKSIEHRSQFPFRQLAWRLPELSPLFTKETIQAVEAAYHRLISELNVVRDEDFNWITSMLVNALTPHFDAEEQLDLLLSMPKSVPEYLHLRYGLKTLTAKILENRLEEAIHNPDSISLRRILFFASATPASLTDRSRQIIAEQMNSSESIVADCAAAVVLKAQDGPLNKLVVKQTQYQNNPTNVQAKYFLRGGPHAAAIIQQNRQDLLHLVAPPFLGHVAVALGGKALDMLADYFEISLKRLLQPLCTPEPKVGRVFLNISNDGFEFTKWADNSKETNPLEDLLSWNENTQDHQVEARVATDYEQEMWRKIDAYEEALAKEGAAIIAFPSQGRGLVEFAKRNPDRIRHWLDLILETRDNRTLRQVYNQGIVLAGTYATHDGNKAAEVLRHLYDYQPFVTVTIGKIQVNLYDQALFGTPDISELDPLREKEFFSAFNDATIEVKVAAAEVCGAINWLDTYINKLLESHHPGDQARGLTIAGLRNTNAVSTHAFERDWGMGFLGEVAKLGAKNYQRAQWAGYWLNCMLNASNPIDFWRFAKLAEGIVDWRFVNWFEGNEVCVLLERFGDELYSRLWKAAAKRSKKREDTLFGLKAPDPDLVMILKDGPPYG